MQGSSPSVTSTQESSVSGEQGTCPVGQPKRIAGQSIPSLVSLSASWQEKMLAKKKNNVRGNAIVKPNLRVKCF